MSLLKLLPQRALFILQATLQVIAPATVPQQAYLPLHLNQLMRVQHTLRNTVLAHLPLSQPMNQQLIALNTLPLHQQVHMVQQLTLLLIALVPRQ